jgi:hypothetical protein
MTNLFGSLDIEIWDFIGIWDLGFDISEYFNTRDSISKDYFSIGYSTVKFQGFGFDSKANRYFYADKF